MQIIDMDQLELALLRRGVDARMADREQCARCKRTPLIGERVYEYERSIVCAVCRPALRQAPQGSRMVHGPEWGHSIRVTDRRAA
jgi:hypothetical protein